MLDHEGSTSSAPAPLGSGPVTDCTALDSQSNQTWTVGQQICYILPFPAFGSPSRGPGAQDSTEVMLHAAALGLLLIRISLN